MHWLKFAVSVICAGVTPGSSVKKYRNDRRSPMRAGQAERLLR